MEAKPISAVSVRKAVSGGRKERTKWERDSQQSKYDPRHPGDRKIDMKAVDQLQQDLHAAIGDCGFLRNYENTLQCEQQVLPI